MVRFMLLAASISILAACQTTTSSTLNAQSPDAALSTKYVKVGGTEFRVLHGTGENIALVGAVVTGDPFTGGDIQTAASEVTGCAATIVPGEWAFLPDLIALRLENLRPNVRRPFPGWQVSLVCDAA